jgi:ubiquinone/menaquinone biosynthesis C-methylase UbiE
MSDMLDPKSRVEGAFDSFAKVYDDVIGKSMTFFINLLIRDLQIPEDPTVLDVGCGTGISTFQLMHRVQGRGKFYGIDISQKMLDLARARAADLGYGNVEFSKGDAEQLDFPESSFDLAISNEAFFFFPDKQKALNEVFRVLKPVGQTALLFFGEPTNREVKEIYKMVRNRHTEYAMPESLKLIDLEETHELFDKAGFKKTRIFGIHEIDYVDPSKYVPMVESPQSFFRLNLPSDLSPELVEMIIKETKEEMTRASADKGFKMTYYNILAYAQKA